MKLYYSTSPWTVFKTLTLFQEPRVHGRVHLQAEEESSGQDVRQHHAQHRTRPPQKISPPPLQFDWFLGIPQFRL